MNHALRRAYAPGVLIRKEESPMFANEGLYTTLTWSQITIGLIVGFIGIYLASAAERLRRNFAAGSQRMLQNEADASPEHPDIPHLVRSIVHAAYYILGALARRSEAVTMRSVVRGIQSLQKNRGDQKPLRPLAIQIAVQRLVAQQHVRLGEHGIEITRSGRELLNRLSRINDRPASEKS